MHTAAPGGPRARPCSDGGPAVPWPTTCPVTKRPRSLPQPCRGRPEHGTSGSARGLPGPRAGRRQAVFTRRPDWGGARSHSSRPSADSFPRWAVTEAPLSRGQWEGLASVCQDDVSRNRTRSPRS